MSFLTCGTGETTIRSTVLVHIGWCCKPKTTWPMCTKDRSVFKAALQKVYETASKKIDSITTKQWVAGRQRHVGVTSSGRRVQNRGLASPRGQDQAHINKNWLELQAFRRTTPPCSNGNMAVGKRTLCLLLKWILVEIMPRLILQPVRWSILGSCPWKLSAWQCREGENHVCRIARMDCDRRARCEGSFLRGYCGTSQGWTGCMYFLQ